MTYRLFILVFWAIFCGACSNDMKEVQMINADKGTPDESMQGVTMVYTDNGRERAILRTKRIYIFGSKQGRTEFPEGLSVDFFNAKGERESFLKSKKGVFNDQNHFLELRDSVKMINYKTNDTLFADYLIWKQDSAIIVVPGKSRIYGESGEFTGYNFRANENFTKSSWKNFRAAYFYNQTDTIK